MNDKKIEQKSGQEPQITGFISQEQYEEAVKAFYSNDKEHAPAGKCGCNISSTSPSEKTGYTYTAVPGVIFPHEASLISGMPPVYAQQERGTCVSMAVTALAEYYTGCTQKYSPQYLYCKCKEYDHKQKMRTILQWFRSCDTETLWQNLNEMCENYVKRFEAAGKVAQANKDYAFKKADIARKMQEMIHSMLCVNDEDTCQEIQNYLTDKETSVVYNKLSKELLKIFRRSQNKNISHQVEHWFEHECAKTLEDPQALLLLKKQILPPLRNNKKESRRMVYDFLASKHEQYRHFLKRVYLLLGEQNVGDLHRRLKMFFKHIHETAPSLADFIADIEKYIHRKLHNNSTKARRAVYDHVNTGLLDLQDEGTSIHAAIDSYNNHGVCSYLTWPYNNADVPFNEGQFVNAPEVFSLPAADKEAAENIPADKMIEIFPPNNVDAFKAVLSGANGNRPMPVVVCMQVFSSWLKSRFTKKTGWLSPPVCEDEQKDFIRHAMLIVGYKDTPKVAGGGYFIVRNSWGTGWAYGSENAGYAKVPYLYAMTYTYEAATILQKKSETELTEEDARMEKFLTLASRDMRDCNGKWTISKGMQIIQDESGAVERDTPENRKIFSENGYSWTKAADASVAQSEEVLEGVQETLKSDSQIYEMLHQSNTTPTREIFDPTAPDENRKSLSGSDWSSPEKRLDFVSGVMRDFIKKLDSNLKQKSRSYCFPNINLPMWTHFLPCQLRVKKIELVDDLSRQLLQAQISCKILDPQYRDIAERSNLCRVYELRNGNIMFRVIAIFMTAIRDGKVQENVDNAYIDCAKSVIKNYELKKKHSLQPIAKICVWGTAENFSSQIKPQLSHDQIEIVTQRRGTDEWTLQVPRVRAGYVWYDFLLHLLPITTPELVDFIDNTIKKICREHNNSDNVPFNLIVEKTGWPAPLVEQMLQQLCKEGRCSCKKGVIKNRGSKRFLFGFHRLRNAFQGYFNCFISTAAFSVGWWCFVNPDMSNRYDIETIAGLALTSYLGNVICVVMSRNINESEKV